MKIEYLIREGDLLESQLLIASQSKNLRKQRWIASISTTVLTLVGCLCSDKSFKLVPAVAISILAGGILFCYIPYIYRRHYLKQIKAHFAGMIGNSVELQVTNDFMETKDSSGETKMKLTAIKNVYETDNLFVVQSDYGSYLTIAKQDIDFVKFRDFLISRGLTVTKTRSKCRTVLRGK
jgi:hypothetical protein